MNRSELQEKINQSFSTYDLAKYFNTSQTNIRYWSRKYGLNTFNVLSLQGERNGLKCACCEAELTGKKKKFCSKKCKAIWHYRLDIKENPNSQSRQKRVSLERKKMLIKLKGGKCMNCGYSKNLAALTFHHRNPENKSFPLDSRRLSNTNLESLLLEAEKCDLLCANCHAELHNPNLEIKWERQDSNL